jgi:nucleoside-diphosphate-sugar epimerase
VDAAARAGVERVIHFSSVRAYSDSQFPDGVDEAWPVRPDGHAYVDTKIASEQVVLQAHAAHEIDVTVLRPGDVYGPGSRPWTVLPVEGIRTGMFLLPDGGRGIFSPAYVDNLIDGVILATSPAGSGQIFNLSDGIGVTNATFFGHYYAMLGKKPRTAPARVARLLFGAAGTADRLRHRPSEATPDLVEYFLRRGTYSIEKARRVLGFEPKVDLAEGMRRTEAWLRAHGFIRA